MIVVEGGGRSKELRNVKIDSERKVHRVYFHSDGSSVLFELKKSSLGGYSYGIVHVNHMGQRYTRRMGRLELEAMRKTLLGGEEHIVLVGDVTLRLRPESISYLFPRESYKRIVKFLMGLWELGRKIRELGRHR